MPLSLSDLDALVITSDSTGRLTPHTRTEHFSGITDGAGLALSGIPVFRGDVHVGGAASARRL